MINKAGAWHKPVNLKCEGGGHVKLRLVYCNVSRTEKHARVIGRRVKAAYKTLPSQL